MGRNLERGESSFFNINLIHRVKENKSGVSDLPKLEDDLQRCGRVLEELEKLRDDANNSFRKCEGQLDEAVGLEQKRL